MELLYPPRCLVCGGQAQPVRWSCTRHFPLEGRSSAGPRCGRCAVALPDFLPDGTSCAECRRRPPPFRRLWSLGDYGPGEALRDWILAVKHGGRRDLAERLGALMGSRLEGESAPSREAVLVPLPLHWGRRLARGFDQAEVLARAAAETSGRRWMRLLRRRRATLPQGTPGARSRRANLRGAFVPLPTAQGLRGLRVVWVDDVVTSGATVAAAKEALAGLGLRYEGVLCAGRAVLRRAEGAPPNGPLRNGAPRARTP